MEVTTRLKRQRIAALAAAIGCAATLMAASMPWYVSAADAKGSRRSQGCRGQCTVNNPAHRSHLLVVIERRERVPCASAQQIRCENSSVDQLPLPDVTDRLVGGPPGISPPLAISSSRAPE